VPDRAEDTHGNSDQKVHDGTVFTKSLEYREGASDADNEPDESTYDAGSEKWALHRSRSSCGCDVRPNVANSRRTKGGKADCSVSG